MFGGPKLQLTLTLGSCQLRAVWKMVLGCKGGFGGLRIGVLSSYVLDTNRKSAVQSRVVGLTLE